MTTTIWCELEEEINKLDIERKEVFAQLCKAGNNSPLEDKYEMLNLRYYRLWDFLFDIKQKLGLR